MSELQDDIFENEFPEEEVDTGAEEVTEEVAETETEEESESQESESKEETAEETTEETEQEPTPDSDKKEPWTLTAVLDEREKRQKAQQDAEELRKELAALKGEPDELSVFDDETAKFDSVDQKIAQAERNAVFNVSEAGAKREFGADQVDAAKKWYAEQGVKSAYIVDTVNNSNDPYYELMKSYEDDMVIRNADKFREQVRAEEREKALAEIKNKPKSDTPSLASKRSVGGAEPPGNDDDFLKD